MKKFAIILLLIALLPVSGWGLGRWSDTKHLVGFWVDGAFVSQPDNLDITKSASGLGGSVGFLYEFQHKKFLLDMGIGAEFNHVGMKVNDSRDSIRAINSDPVSLADSVTIGYSFSDRRDRIDMLNLQIPIMVGAQWKNFYFLVGPKFSFNLIGITQVKSSLTTTGVPDMFNGVYHDMSQHGYVTDVKQSSRGNITFQPQIYASLELGFRIGERQWERGQGFNLFYKGKTQQRLGFFVDYGLLNQHNNKEYAMVELPTSVQNAGNTHIDDLKVNHIYNTTSALNSVVHQLRIGVKYTLLFNIPTAVPCVHCVDRPIKRRHHG